MTDATRSHRHAHGHAVGRARDHASERAPDARASLLEASAAARLFVVSLVAAALWAGVYWALH